MATPRGQSDLALIPDSVKQKLFEVPRSFDFFQAVRLLHRMNGAMPTGFFHDIGGEVARFVAQPDLNFPTSEIHALTQREDAPPLLSTQFLGLVGVLGLLPTFYSSLVTSRISQKDNALRDFLDIFHHRIMSLFYRAWEKSHFTIPLERGEPDSVSPHLLDLVGLGTPGLSGQQAVPDDALLSYTGLLAQSPRSASALQSILSDYFEVPVEIECFAGIWRGLDKSSRFRLDEPGMASTLASGMALGMEIWDRQSMIRIRLGPLTMEQYRQFLPDGDAFQPLRAIQRFYCGEEIDAELQLVLDKKEAPRSSLTGDTAARPRLGWISWLYAKPLEQNPDQTILRLWEYE